MARQVAMAPSLRSGKSYDATLGGLTDLLYFAKYKHRRESAYDRPSCSPGFPHEAGGGARFPAERDPPWALRARPIPEAIPTREGPRRRLDAGTRGCARTAGAGNPGS